MMEVKSFKLMMGVVIVLITIALTSCNYLYSDFKDDWFIIVLKDKNEVITNQLLLRNISIRPGRSSFIPDVYSKKYYELRGDETNKSYFWIEDGEYYVYFDTRSYFRDTFMIRCHGPNCCEITLQNDEKFVHAVYNGELGLTTVQNRRDCPTWEERRRQKEQYDKEHGIVREKKPKMPRYRKNPAFDSIREELKELKQRDTIAPWRD